MTATHRELLKWEAQLASLATAAFRPLAQALLEPAGGAEATHTVAAKAAKRVVLYHPEDSNDEIHFALNETADGDHMPLATGAYFVVEVAVGDVIHIFNSNTGAGARVYVMEIL